MVKCNLCNQELGRITETHLWHKHKIHFSEFIRRFPDTNIGPMPWNKCDTKDNNLSLLKLSNALKAKNKWNFSRWQSKRKEQGIVARKALLKNENSAELIGIVLGDGNLYKHPRTENLRITCNANDIAYARHVSCIIKKVFDKAPNIRKRNDENAISIDLYQCEISRRLNLPCGNKIENNIGIPSWIY